MFTLFTPQKTASIGLCEGAEEAVVLAARDLQRNLRALSGREDGFEVLCGEADIRIETVMDESESYVVTVDGDGVRIEGGDALGTVFGIYAFATKVLGIDPMYRLTDLFPTVRDSLSVEDVSFRSQARPIRYRGWFLNDEDLLTEFKSGGGVRHFDYKFYQTVMHPDVLDMILETALRHEINLIIPSSFVDIDNPDEEKLADASVRRGLYVTQHHVEPVGVSYFGAQNYMKKFGREGEVSFIANRAVMEEIWEYYVKKWAKYGDRVIWQLGLRGRADEAVWKRDKNVPMTSEGRGAIITDAIRTQYDMIRKTLGHEHFVSTATLWLEGAQLYGEGHLRLPESTIAIFSDVGFDQMWGEDFYRTQRREGCRYGVYYHVAFYSRGPHLAEGCDPRKMTYCYREALAMDSLTYSIVNVSNVRPLHYSASYNAALMADPEGTDYDAYAEDVHRRHFGEAATLVKSLRDRYYLAKAKVGEDILRARCATDNFYQHHYEDLAFPRCTADDGELWMCVRGLFRDKALVIQTYRRELERSEAAFSALLCDARAAEASIPAESLDYYRTFFQYQTEYMLCMTRWVLACYRLFEGAAKDRPHLEQMAVSHLERILEARKIEARGWWADWHAGEKKINVLQCIQMTHELAGGVS